MQKGIVKANMITLKKGGYLHKGKVVGESDVIGFNELVKRGSIEIIKTAKPEPKEVKKEEAKKPSK